MITAFHYNPSFPPNEMEDAGVKASLRVENDSHATSARRCLTVHIKYCQSWSKWSMLGLQGCSAICWARSKNRSNSEPLSYFVLFFSPSIAQACVKIFCKCYTHPPCLTQTPAMVSDVGRRRTLATFFRSDPTEPK